MYFIRDKISGTHYFIYAFICFLFLFAIVGYLFKQKYAKIEFKLGTGGQQAAPPTKKDLKKASKNAKKKGKSKGGTPANALPVNNQQPVALQPQVSQTQTIQQPQTGGLQQPTSLPNLNQTTPSVQTSPTQASNGIPEIIK